MTGGVVAVRAIGSFYLYGRTVRPGAIVTVGETVAERLVAGGVAVRLGDVAKVREPERHETAAAPGRGH